MANKFFSVTKPGIIFGNVITVAGGFFLSARGNIHFEVFIATLVGISLIIASGCVFNNYIDRDIDKVMERTKNRVLVLGTLSAPVALIYASILGIAGVVLLAWQTNQLTVAVSLLGLLVYVGIYSLWLKRGSIHGTVVGSISGAIPPVVGYCANTGRLDAGAIILFVMLCLWQMPHSYAIAIFRFKDYQAARIPVLPVVKGVRVAKNYMLAYVLAFSVATLQLYIFGYTGLFYCAGALVMGVLWLRLSLRGFKARDELSWARKMFGFSILTITTLSILMAIDFVPLTH